MSDKSPASSRRLSSIFAPLTFQNDGERLVDFQSESSESSPAGGNNSLNGSTNHSSSRRNSFIYGSERGGGSSSAAMTPKDLTLRSLQSTTSSSSTQSTHSENCGQTLSAIRKLAMECRSMPNSPRMIPKHTANRDYGRPPVPNQTATHFSALTDHLNVQQVNKYNHGEFPEINWQERCLELQLELHRSKNQSERIRGMLRDKVSL